MSKGVIQTSFFICIVAIEYLATTTISIPVVENSWDKLNHFIAFFVLYILFSLSYPRFLTTLGKVVVLLLFAIQIEIIQYFIPNRYFSFLDIVADGIGILIGIVFYKWLINSRLISYFITLSGK
ncbi:MAG: VanZ family protein [Campylobacterales bacterium]|nr:VanZ family protein [Campylobacterales bacterium]